MTDKDTEKIDSFIKQMNNGIAPRMLFWEAIAYGRTSMLRRVKNELALNEAGTDLTSYGWIMNVLDHLSSHEN